MLAGRWESGEGFVRLSGIRGEKTSPFIPFGDWLGRWTSPSLLLRCKDKHRQNVDRLKKDRILPTFTLHIHSLKHNPSCQEQTHRPNCSRIHKPLNLGRGCIRPLRPHSLPQHPRRKSSNPHQRSSSQRQWQQGRCKPRKCRMVRRRRRRIDGRS